MPRDGVHHGPSLRSGHRFVETAPYGPVHWAGSPEAVDRRKLQHFQTQNILIKSVGGAMLLEAQIIALGFAGSKCRLAS